MPIKKVSVIIVNYNGAGFLEPCIESLFQSNVVIPFEVIVVDNNSQDDSPAILKRYNDKVKVIFNKKNQGFSYANNQAAKIAKGDAVFLLNNDTVLEPNTLQILVDFLDSHSDAGAITPKLLNSDGTLQSPGSIWGQARFKSDVPVKVPFIAGAAVLMKKTDYDAMGGLDENLFFYNDDVDMCKTLKKLGRAIYYVPTAKLIHYGGLSTKFRRVASLIEGYRGGIYLSHKHYGAIVHLFYRLFLMIDILLNILVRTLLSPFSKHQRDFLKGYLEILRINLLNDVYLKRE